MSLGARERAGLLIEGCPSPLPVLDSVKFFIKNMYMYSFVSVVLPAPEKGLPRVEIS